MVTAEVEIKDDEEQKLGVEKMIPMCRIKPRDDQPRESFDQGKLQELATSITSVGLVTAIEVRPIEDGGADYEVIEGGRRFIANLMLERKEVRCLIKPPYSDDEAWVHSLIANTCREGYTPRELVHQITRLQSMGWSNGEIASAFGRSEGWLYQYTKLQGLPEIILDMMAPSRPEKNRLKLAVAVLLAQIKDNELLQLEMARKICSEGMDVESALHLVSHDIGQRVGTMAQSPKADWNRFVTLSQQVGPRVDRIMNLPGTRFNEMFMERTADEVSTLHAKLLEACEGLKALSDVVGQIAKKKMAELGNE